MKVDQNPRVQCRAFQHLGGKWPLLPTPHAVYLGEIVAQVVLGKRAEGAKTSVFAFLVELQSLLGHAEDRLVHHDVVDEVERGRVFDVAVENFHDLVVIQEGLQELMHPSVERDRVEDDGPLIGRKLY